MADGAGLLVTIPEDSDRELDPRPPSPLPVRVEYNNDQSDHRKFRRIKSFTPFNHFLYFFVFIFLLFCF